MPTPERQTGTAVANGTEQLPSPSPAVPQPGMFALHPMSRVALRMLIGDRAKYLGLVFAVAFSSFLISQQAALFCGLMDRARSQISDLREADLWVMDPATMYIDEVYPLKDFDLYRVRGIKGVAWAVPLFKAAQSAKTESGFFRSVSVMGLDDATLTGVPRQLIVGDLASLREPDAAFIDDIGYHLLYPDEPFRLGHVLELNDHRIRLVGVCRPSPTFNSNVLLYSRYSLAINLIGRQRNQMSFVLVKAQPAIALPQLAARIQSAVRLKAWTRHDFGWKTIRYYIENTGIPISFGLTVAVAILVGTVVAGQTFYMFTLENLRQFGALKAIGTTNRRIVGMILLQALVVGALGYGIGIGLSATFFLFLQSQDATRGIVLIWQIAGSTALIVAGIVAAASLFSVRKVLLLEPAIVFRS